VAKFMTDLKWGPLMGGLVIKKDIWNRIPPDQQARMLTASNAAARTMSADIRRLGDEAVPAMVKRGLTVVKLDPAALAQWQKETEDFWPLMRGKMGPPAYTDEVIKYRNEYRARKAH
jgi:TRAP-type C4-dicarboxylate transport system substrate-binding protein